jgi:hypothetical protein
MLKWFIKLINRNLVEAEVIKVEKVKCTLNPSSNIAKAGYTEEDCGECYHYLAKLPGKEKYWICRNWEYEFVYVHYINEQVPRMRREDKVFYKKYEVGDKIEVYDDEDKSEFNGDDWERCDP